MKYYNLVYDYENDSDKVLAISGELYSITKYDISKGIELSTWDERTTFCYNPREGNQFTDYLGNNLNWPIVSNKFRETIADLQKCGIQYFPVVIKSTQNAQEHVFLVANILSKSGVLDLENSLYDEWDIDGTRKMLAFEMHALKQDALKDIHIFRLEEDLTPIFISQKLKDAIEGNGITGCDFIEVKST